MNGKDVDVKAAGEQAYTAALNVLALTKKQLGSLNRVSHVVRLGVYAAWLAAAFFFVYKTNRSVLKCTRKGQSDGDNANPGASR